MSSKVDSEGSAAGVPAPRNQPDEQRQAILKHLRLRRQDVADDTEFSEGAELDLLIRELEAGGVSAPHAQPARTWQPIATAPTEELVLIHDEGYVGKAIREDDGRWLDTECGRADAHFNSPPQHWMPLQNPPGALTGGDPAPPSPQKFAFEPWDAGDYVVTMNGKPVGQSCSKSQASHLAHWLPTAIAELRAASSPSTPPPPQQE